MANKNEVFMYTYKDKLRFWSRYTYKQQLQIN